MGDWPLVPIGEVAALYDGPHQTAPLDPDGPVTYLNVGDIRGGRIALSLSGRVSESTAAIWTRRVEPRLGDVVFGYEAKVGEAAMLTDDHRWCLGRRVGLLRPDPDRIDPRYLSYAWYSKHFQDTLRAHRIGGTTIESIRLTDLPLWLIALPPLAEQRRIAGILGALDDKIELNRRMATTLEILGRFTYRQWRETLPQTDFRPIGDVCQVSSGGTPSRRIEELWTGPIPWISPKVMTSIHCDEPSEWVSPTAIGRGTRLAPAGSTLVMVRGMGLHELVRVSQAREDVTFNQDVKSLTPMGLEPAMLLFSVLDAQDILLARVESSGHGTGVLPTSALTGHLVAAPKADVRRAVAERLELVNARIGVVRSAARTLASLRDALLPRLLGGPEMR